MIRYRPVAMTDAARPDTALPLAGGWCWFDRVEVLERGRAPHLVAAADLPGEVRDRLSRPRPALAGLGLDRPRLMGILNVTPDSFSDGGRFLDPAAALVRGRQLAEAGADIIDIGGESTRPGAAPVAEADEIARTLPVVEALRQTGVPLSIDTRKAGVARAALAAGAAIINDVSGLRHDPALAGVTAAAGAPLVLVHARGDPATMQADPRYGDVLLDVFDDLAESVAMAAAAGIAADRIVVDPGIGFGKTVAHNLALIRRLSLFHDLGLPLLLGASRKRFIGSVGGAVDPDARLPGSIAVALAGAEQGVQVLRVHDVGETRQALALWQATRPGEGAGGKE
jgi:dihydropteroate synthase